MKFGNIIDKTPDFAFWLPYMAFASNVAYHVYSNKRHAVITSEIFHFLKIWTQEFEFQNVNASFVHF
jgi:hypothetical protein